MVVEQLLRESQYQQVLLILRSISRSIGYTLSTSALLCVHVRLTISLPSARVTPALPPNSRPPPFPLPDKSLADQLHLPY